MTSRKTPDVLVPFYSDNRTVVCIASGPSVTQEQIDIIGRVKESDSNHLFVIGVNDNWKWKYDGQYITDCCYAADKEWWIIWNDQMISSGYDKPRMIPIQVELAKAKGLLLIPCIHQHGLGTQGKVHCLSHSGAQAIGVAYYIGASKIILVGYDMKTSGSKIHWFGDHGPGLRNTPNRYQSWLHHYNNLSKDFKKYQIDVINCSPDSALIQFRQEKLSEKLLLSG